MKIKRYLSIFFMIVFCFLMQTTVLSHFKLTNIIPNFLVIMTSASGFMFGRRYGMFAGVICGGLMDLIYGDVIGVCIFIFVLIGFLNGLANKYYFKDDLSIPLSAMGLSDLAFGMLYYICNFLLCGRLDFLAYVKDIMIPEMIYTILFGVILYKFLYWLDDKLYPPEEIPLHKNDRLY